MEEMCVDPASLWSGPRVTHGEVPVQIRVMMSVTSVTELVTGHATVLVIAMEVEEEVVVVMVALDTEAVVVTGHQDDTGLGLDPVIVVGGEAGPATDTAAVYLAAEVGLPGPTTLSRTQPAVDHVVAATDPWVYTSCGSVRQHHIMDNDWQDGLMLLFFMSQTLAATL